MQSILKRRHTEWTLMTVVLVALFAPPTLAQQLSGSPGSPSATEFIKGDQLPPPPTPFGGVI
jgi:arylsulfatase